MRNPSIFLFLTLSLALSSTAWGVTSQEYLSAGLSLCQKKQWDQASPYLKAAVQVDPQNWQPFKPLGIVFINSIKTRRRLMPLTKAWPFTLTILRLKPLPKPYEISRVVPRPPPFQDPVRPLPRQAFRPRWIPLPARGKRPSQRSGMKG